MNCTFCFCRFILACFWMPWVMSQTLWVKTICLSMKLKRTLEKLSNGSLVYSYRVIVRQVQGSWDFFNLIPDANAFERMFYTYRSGIDYNAECFKILNLKWWFFVIIWSRHFTKNSPLTSMYLFLKKEVCASGFQISNIWLWILW